MLFYYYQKVKNCTWSDDVYGPYAECVKAATGAEAEEALKKMLRDRKIAFKDEDDLRREGYDKTPDIKLIAPFGFRGKVLMNLNNYNIPHKLRLFPKFDIK